MSTFSTCKIGLNSDGKRFMDIFMDDCWIIYIETVVDDFEEIWEALKIGEDGKMSHLVVGRPN